MTHSNRSYVERNAARKKIRRKVGGKDNVIRCTVRRKGCRYGRQVGR